MRLTCPEQAKEPPEGGSFRRWGAHAGYDFQAQHGTWLHSEAGIEGEMLSKLCDIAMSGDRGIGSRFENFEFHLGKTIAQRNKVCEVAFTRKKA